MVSLLRHSAVQYHSVVYVCHRRSMYAYDKSHISLFLHWWQIICLPFNISGSPKSIFCTNSLTDVRAIKILLKDKRSNTRSEQIQNFRIGSLLYHKWEYEFSSPHPTGYWNAKWMIASGICWISEHRLCEFCNFFGEMKTHCYCVCCETGLKVIRDAGTEYDGLQCIIPFIKWLDILHNKKTYNILLKRYFIRQIYLVCSAGRYSPWHNTKRLCEGDSIFITLCITFSNYTDIFN